MELEGKTAIITGGGRGIGQGICLSLGSKGADIAIVDIDLSMANTTAEKVKSLGRKGIAIKTDVSKNDEISRMVESVLEEFGKIDILVNAAGIVNYSSLIDLEENEWDRVMNVNAKAVFLCCKVVAKHMVERKEGKIINIASQAGKKGEPYNVAYCASKSAVISITQTLALELAPFRINVNAICPGLVDTPMLREVFAERAPMYGLVANTYREQLVKEIPLGRIGEPSDIAKVALFLASDYSDYMTGQAINVTGGLISH